MYQVSQPLVDAWRKRLKEKEAANKEQKERETPFDPYNIRTTRRTKAAAFREIDTSNKGSGLSRASLYDASFNRAEPRTSFFEGAANHYNNNHPSSTINGYQEVGYYYNPPYSQPQYIPITATPNTDALPQQQYYPWGLGVGQPSVTIQPTFPKTKYDPEGFRGRFIAFVTYAPPEQAGETKSGLLFVRKCGSWKLIEPVSFLKVASGSEGSYDNHSQYFTVHYFVVNNEVKHKKSERKEMNRFAEIDIVMPQEA
jgi:hypothetical protein